MTHRTKKHLFLAVCLFSFLFIAWNAFIPHYNILNIVVGLIISTTVTLLMGRVHLLHGESIIHVLNIRFLHYTLYVLKDIIESNIRVAYFIFRKNPPHNCLVFVPLSEKTTDIKRTVFSNTITITPGTLAIIEDLHLKECEFCVLIHTLDMTIINPDVVNWYIK